METHVTPPSSPSTTFIQADITTFRHLVQKLTGVDGDPSPKPSTYPSRPVLKTSSSHLDHTAPRRSTFKLRERRHNMRNLEIKLGLASLDQTLSPRSAHMVEGSLSLSPVTPLGTELTLSPSSDEEDRAIAERGFYLHPSPLSTPGGDPPELLSLFPLSSVPNTQANHG